MFDAISQAGILAAWLGLIDLTIHVAGLVPESPSTEDKFRGSKADLLTVSLEMLKG